MSHSPASPPTPSHTAFWASPPPHQRLVPLLTSDIQCEATLQLSDDERAAYRHVYIALGGLWYSAVRTK